jgi:molecular chaperone GrpE
MTDERYQREKKSHDTRHPAREPGVQHPSGQPVDSPGGQPGDRIAELEAELAAARAEAEDARERWVRERADAENLKKRTARERADAVRFGTENLVRDLLPVVDNLERAVQAAQGGGDGAPLVEGVSLVLKALLDVLARHGVTRVEAEGARFDPAHHEAVAHVESAEHEPNSVIQEHQAGYRLHDRLLRPAMVSVSKGPSNLANPEGGD